ncbi:Pre-mRNA-splicing factor CWC22 homolog, partial [Linum perenne]
KRVQFLIEGVFAIRKAKFRGYPELDLVEQEEQITHEISLRDEGIDHENETSFDVFKPDLDYTKNEKQYEDLKRNIHQ